MNTWFMKKVRNANFSPCTLCMGEVVDDGKWYGLDPTNNILVQDSHIKIGCGRDATECQINRGIMHGGGEQTQDIYVNVSEISPGQSIISRGALF